MSELYELLTFEAFGQRYPELTARHQILPGRGVFCKAERLQSGVIGTYAMPQRMAPTGEKHFFGYYLTEKKLLLVEKGLLVSRTARLQRDFLATLHTTADAQLLASLKQREQAMREAWQQHQRQRQQYQRRSAIAAWQPRLQALAADLPAQAWLTRLEYQGVLLTLDGLALNLQALTSVEAALTRVAGFAPAKAGGTQRDAEGRWQFSFTLTGARADAD